MFAKPPSKTPLLLVPETPFLQSPPSGDAEMIASGQQKEKTIRISILIRLPSGYALHFGTMCVAYRKSGWAAGGDFSRKEMPWVGPDVMQSGFGVNFLFWPDEL